MANTVSLEELVQDVSISLEAISLCEFVALFYGGDDDKQEPVDKCDIWTF
ncbi:hypothetical protein [Sphingobacterium wenxiniae]|uniref:Uncharacterized protein n=1 Tax=Sphingobacterium wenxiniae TaxID=683125 RepID=A0A1I6TI31_9SPHI|nr:hypothetical protein [Sphingobacterium wenxiniae]SFS88830.1 hypothetical protein SAMN05660206_106162 [Sphingobacterium wenxiniae]